MRKINPAIVQDLIFVICKIEESGKRRVISTSKIKKITAIRKNRREKGSRADPFGSNPHSNGDLFSRSEIIFFERIEAIIITKVEIKKMIITAVEIIIIVFSKIHLVLLVGSQLYFYTKKTSTSPVDCNIQE